MNRISIKDIYDNLYLRFGGNFGMITAGNLLCNSSIVSGNVKNAIADNIILSLQL